MQDSDAAEGAKMVRIEPDSPGPVEVPIAAPWGGRALRAIVIESGLLPLETIDAIFGGPPMTSGSA